MNVFEKIAASVEARLHERKKKLSFDELCVKAAASRTPHDFTAPFLESKDCIIAEVKFKSPALGHLQATGEAEAVAIASAYQAAGATAISVLTEEDHFNGNLSYLEAVRKALPEARLLMKDFIMEEYQILEARLHGADCILLIVSLLGHERTTQLLKFAKALKLEALIEVHDEAELVAAMKVSAPLIGVNNRNLKTLEVHLDTSFQLAKKLKPKHVFISESGISTAADIKKLSAAGYSGFLMGTTFMKSGDPGAALSKILQEVRA